MNGAPICLPYQVRTGCGHVVTRKMRPSTASSVLDIMGDVAVTDVVILAPGGNPCDACRAPIHPATPPPAPAAAAEVVTKIVPSKLAQDLRDAFAASRAACDGLDDGGTCNFDSPVLYARATKAITDAIREAGGDFFKGSGFHKGGLVLAFPCPGQANRRSRFAERMTAELVARGYETTMYFQCD